MNIMTREESIKWLESLKAEIGKAEHRTLWHYAEAIDMAIEALQTEPVKHGEWIDHGTTCQRYECSVCGDQHDWLILPNNINFCPNCGAKMKGQEDD